MGRSIWDDRGHTQDQTPAGHSKRVDATSRGAGPNVCVVNLNGDSDAGYTDDDQRGPVAELADAVDLKSAASQGA